MKRTQQSILPDGLIRQLQDVIGPAQVSADLLSLSAVAADASHYLLMPGALVRATTADDVARAMAAARRHKVGLTFRSGGTSLSGQGLTDGIMVDTRRAFRGIEVLDEGRRVRVQPK